MVHEQILTVFSSPLSPISPASFSCFHFSSTGFGADKPTYQCPVCQRAFREEEEVAVHLDRDGCMTSGNPARNERLAALENRLNKKKAVSAKNKQQQREEHWNRYAEFGVGSVFTQDDSKVRVVVWYGN